MLLYQIFIQTTEISLILSAINGVSMREEEVVDYYVRTILTTCSNLHNSRVI